MSLATITVETPHFAFVGDYLSIDRDQKKVIVKVVEVVTETSFTIKVRRNSKGWRRHVRREKARGR